MEYEGGKPESQGFASGKGEHLEEAFQDAWEQAKAAGNEEPTLKVVDIFVEGTNPLSGYSVVLGHT
jgi:flagellar biosynthesis/type III secretory pathway protein FliH